MPVKVGGVSLLLAEVFEPQRCFGILREVVVAGRELVVVFRSVGCSAFKLKLKYKVNVMGKVNIVARGLSALQKAALDFAYK